MALDPNKIQKPIRKIRKILKKNPKEPTPEDVHDLRTNTRRLEAALSALSLDSSGQERRLLKDSRRIRRRAGKVRDMDVLTSFAAKVHPEEEQDCRVQLLEHLGAERRKQARKLHAKITKYGAAVRGRLKKTNADLEQALSAKGNDGANRGAAGQATASALQIQSELASPARLGRNNLHPYRLKVKEMHNILKMTANLDGHEFTDTLGKVKDAIGEWHDWEELLAIAKDVLDHGAQCRLLQQLKRIADRKYEEALSEAESMRTKYLGVSSGQRRRGQPRPSETVWKATRAIAA